MGNASPHEEISITIKTEVEKQDSRFLHKLLEILISNVFLQNKKQFYLKIVIHLQMHSMILVGKPREETA